MVRVEIVEGSLSVPRGIGYDPGPAGAIVEFHGVVRDEEEGRPIRGIDYECHRKMAQHQLQQIASEIASTYGLLEFVVLHRVGPVMAGETSLYVRAIASHRGEAFAAAADLITRLKDDVPVWKHPIEA
jgi:molybdopterin synthase catalytic subunit